MPAGIDFVFEKQKERMEEMAKEKDEVKKKDNYEWLIAVVYLIVGAAFIIVRGGVMNWLMTAVGIAFLILGIIEIIKKNYTQGIVSVIVGAVVIVGGWFFVAIALIVFGVLMIVKSVMDLPAAIKSKKPVPIASALITLVIGAVLALCGFGKGGWFFGIGDAIFNILFIVIGVIFVINGITKLISFFQLK